MSGLLRKWFSRPVAPDAGAEPPRALVYYFPEFHCDPRNAQRRGRTWTEWDLVRAAVPRFPGHRQPKVPLWGYGDDSDPQHMALKIDAAADHGIDAFLFDWYYYDEGPFLEGALDRGYLAAPNRDRLKFALMWGNHDWPDVHPARRAVAPPVVYRGRVRPETFLALCQTAIRRYFSHPCYLRLGGRPYFSIYEPGKLVQSFGSVRAARRALRGFREAVRAAGFDGLHLNGIAWSSGLLPGEPSTPRPEQLVRRLELDSATSYVWVHHMALPRLETGYDEARDAYFAFWERARRRFGVPFFPNVTMGWDPSPRAHADDAFQPPATYPFTNTIAGNTPERFRAALQLARERAALLPPGSRLVTINAWNEWTEGSYLEPDSVHGLSYLEAVRAVFGAQRPSSE